MDIAALLLGALGGLGSGIVREIFPRVFSEAIQTSFNRLAPISPRPVETIIRLRLLGLISDDTFHSYMKHYGYSPHVADDMLNAAKNYLSAAEIVMAYYREKGPGRPSDADLNAITQELVKRGFAEEDARKFALIAHPYPSPSDIIVWAVREAFSPEVVSRWGLDEAYPAELDEWGRAVGWTPEVLKYYWRAHWQWPSPTQAAEFVHRTSPKWWTGPKFTEEDYKLILRLADYVPGTIPLFRSTLYAPFTRVDVRRMHQLGILSDDDLVDAYKELGYDEWHAQKLAEFTIKYNADVEPTEERTLTRSLIERAYDLGVITHEEALAMLQEIGYSEEKASLILSIIDTDKKLDDAEDLLSAYLKQFRYDLITEGEFIRRLQSLGFPEERIAHFVEVGRALKEQPERLPTKTDLKNLYKAGYITRDELKNALIRSGYSEYWAEKLIKYWEGAEEREQAVREAAESEE